jgi:hypothetical protein
MHLDLEEMKHPQPATPIHTDNTIADGVVDGTVRVPSEETAVLKTALKKYRSSRPVC